VVVKLGRPADSVQQMKIADPGLRKGHKGGDAGAGGDEDGRITEGLEEKKAEGRAQVKNPAQGSTGQLRGDLPLGNVPYADGQSVIPGCIDQ
jgi:hypothetical protein